MQALLERKGPRLARAAGILYVIVIITGVPLLAGFAGLVVGGDAAATASNIAANGSIVRLAFAGYLLSTAAYAAVMVLFYELLRPVSRPLALAMLVFGVVGSTIGAISVLFVDGASVLIAAPHAAALGQQNSQDLALLMTQFFYLAFDISLIFFGLQCVITGWLFAQSGIVPRWLGVWVSIGGLGYLTFLVPPFAESLFPFNVLPGYSAELVLTLWLLFIGIDAVRWAERLGPSRETSATAA